MHPLANALIVVDVQNDFCPGGSLAVDHGDEIADNINRFIHEHNDEYKTIVATKDWHPSPDADSTFSHFSDTPDYVDTWPPHCVAGTAGADFHIDLNAEDPTDSDGFPAHDERIVLFDKIFFKGQTAAAYSGFEGGAYPENGHEYLGLRETLHDYLVRCGVGHVDIVGLATDYCVKATAIDAHKMGYDTTVLLSMCAGVSRDSTTAAIEEMIRAGVHIDGWRG